MLGNVNEVIKETSFLLLGLKVIFCKTSYFAEAKSHRFFAVKLKLATKGLILLLTSSVAEKTLK